MNSTRGFLPLLTLYLVTVGPIAGAWVYLLYKVLSRLRDEPKTLKRRL